MVTCDRTNPNDQPRLGHTSPMLVAIFSLLTFGIYLPLWYLNRLDRLNGLDTPKKISGRLAGVLLVLYLVNASGFLSFAGGGSITSILTLSSVGHILTMVGGLILVSLRLRVREMLLESYGDRFATPGTVSWLACAIVGELYLQAKMNRLPAPTASPSSIPVARPAQFQPS